MRKIYLLPIFIVMAVLLGLFVYWSNERVTPKVEQIVEDIDNNTWDIKDKIGDIISNDTTTFKTGDIIVWNHSGTRVAYAWWYDNSYNPQYKHIPIDQLTQRHRVAERKDDSYFELTSFHHNEDDHLIYAVIASWNQWILYTYDLLQHKVIEEEYLRDEEWNITIFAIWTWVDNYLDLIYVGCRWCEWSPEPDHYIYNVTTKRYINLGYVGDVRIAAEEKKVYYRNMDYTFVACDEEIMAMGCENGQMKDRKPTGSVLEKDLP